MSLANAQSAAHFASPLLGGDGDLAQFMMSEYVRALIEIAGTNSTILDQLGDPSADPFPWPAIWNPSLAELERRLFRSADPSVIERAVSPLLIHFAAANRLGKARLPLDPERPARWARIKLPTSEWVAFQSSGSEVALELGRPYGKTETMAIARSADGAWASRQANLVPAVQFGPFPMMLHASADDGGYPLPGRQRTADVTAEQVQGAFTDAAGLIGEHAPAFLPWIGASIGSIVALDPSNGVRMSATVEEFPGLVYLSLPAEPLELAARLVHEASHQHFYALRRLGALHDGSDAKGYYSPIKDRERPIETILFAFHAFGNGALFHRALPREGTRFCQIIGETVESMQDKLRELHGHLGRTTALTEPGNALWLPIAQRLFGTTKDR